MASNEKEVILQLRRRLSHDLGRSGAARAGAAVAIEGYANIVDLGGDILMPPNSTQKLYVAAAALRTLMPNSRLMTELFSEIQASRDGTLRGDLQFVASGDPTLSTESIHDMARSVPAAGIRRVNGALVVDVSRYDRVRDAPGWQSHFIPHFTGPLSALAIDRNRWSTDPRFLRHPDLHNARRIEGFLGQQGIEIDGGAKVGEVASSGAILAQTQSPDVLRLVGLILRESDNFMSELLLKELGAVAGAGSTQGGIQVIRQMSSELGLEPPQHLLDGSGLSRSNRDTAGHQVAWLKAVEESSVGNQFRESLSVSGEEGSLGARLPRNGRREKIYAKTGTRLYDLSVNLAGYATHNQGRRIWFSFMLEGAHSLQAGRDAIDSALLHVIESAL